MVSSIAAKGLLEANIATGTVKYWRSLCISRAGSRAHPPVFHWLIHWKWVGAAAEEIWKSRKKCFLLLCSAFVGSSLPFPFLRTKICRQCRSPKILTCSHFDKFDFFELERGLWGPGPSEYSRVLDYSIFKSLLVPYSENITTRPSSRVVAIFTFLVRIIQISKKKTEKGHFSDDLMYHPQQCLSPFIMEFMY